MLGLKFMVDCKKDFNMVLNQGEKNKGKSRDHKR